MNLYEALVALNKDLAEAALGYRPGRPTLSRRAGGVIGKTLGLTTNTGTHVFHGALVVLVLAVLIRR